MYYHKPQEILKYKMLFPEEDEFELIPELEFVNETEISTSSRVLTYTTKDVIDDSISIPAQHSLVRLSKNPVTNVDALNLLEEIKAGRIGGIYCVNWKIPAQRALKFGKTWWTVIPQGEDAIIMLDPDNLLAGSPIIALRRELDPNCGLLQNEKKFAASPQKIDEALLKIWLSYKYWRTGNLKQCEIHPSYSIPVTNILPPGFCQLSEKSELPSQCSTGLAKAPTNTTGEILFFEQGPKRNPTCTQINPKLCFYQVQEQPSTLLSKKELQSFKDFKGCADNLAKRICAIGNPTNFPLDFKCLVNDQVQVGSAPYVSGEHIIRTLICASQSLQTKINEVHIFSHSTRGAIPGSLKAHACGLYASWITLNSDDRNCGAKHIIELPVHVLADDVIFLLHGCNTANSTGTISCNRTSCRLLPIRGPSIAEELSNFLIASGLNKSKVYGHPVSINVGANNNWVEFPSKKKIPGRINSGLSHFCL